MCGLYGFIDTKNKKVNKAALIRGLAVAAQVRGTHATGIAYVTPAGEIAVQKAAKAAKDFKFSLPKNVKAVMGHTRHTTQGTEKRNHNNHPFINADGTFALAHNGILVNDKELKISENLPQTEIETDSYVAVQLLDKYGFDLKKMAELVSGMFTFTILDKDGNLHIVKNDSPFYLIEMGGLYVYGSTKEIVQAGLQAAGLKQKFKEIPVKQGDILTITATGKMRHDSFVPNESAWARWAYERYTSDSNVLLDWYGLTEDEIQLLYDNYDEDYVQYLIDHDEVEKALFELLREEYRWMKRELNWYDRIYGRDLLYTN